TPVAITRIDGHAMLANQVALDMAGITPNTSAEGGAIEIKDGKLTGLLIDNPMDLVSKAMGEPSLEEQIDALLEAQKISFSYGLTTVDDAGIDRSTVELIDSLHKNDQLQVRIYAMLSNTPENLDHYLDK